MALYDFTTYTETGLPGKLVVRAPVRQHLPDDPVIALFDDERDGPFVLAPATGRREEALCDEAAHRADVLVRPANVGLPAARGADALNHPPGLDALFVRPGDDGGVRPGDRVNKLMELPEKIFGRHV